MNIQTDTRGREPLLLCDRFSRGGDHRTPEFGLEGILKLIRSQPQLHHLLEFTAVAFAGKNDNLGSLHPDPHTPSPGSDRGLWGCNL